MIRPSVDTRCGMTHLSDILVLHSVPTDPGVRPFGHFRSEFESVSCPMKFHRQETLVFPLVVHPSFRVHVLADGTMSRRGDSCWAIGSALRYSWFIAPRISSVVVRNPTPTTWGTSRPLLATVRFRATQRNVRRDSGFHVSKVSSSRKGVH
jgi:hypothetical protein